MHETQEEQEETQVLQVCLGLGRFGHAFATKELDPYLGEKITNYSSLFFNYKEFSGTSNQSINKQCAVCAEVDPYLRETVFPQQSLILCHSQSMHETQEEHMASQVQVQPEISWAAKYRKLFPVPNANQSPSAGFRP